MFTHVRKKDLFRLSLDSKSLQKKVMSPLFQRLAAQLKKQKCVIARPDPVFLQDYAFITPARGNSGKHSL